MLLLHQQHSIQNSTIARGPVRMQIYPRRGFREIPLVSGQWRPDTGTCPFC